MAKRKQQGGGRVMMWVGIIDQPIIRPFNIYKWVKLNSANYCDFMDKNLCAWYKSLSCSFKVKCVLMDNNASFMYISLPANSLSIKYLQKKRKCNGHHQVLIWIRSKIYGQLWRWHCMMVSPSFRYTWYIVSQAFFTAFLHRSKSIRTKNKVVPVLVESRMW